MTVCINENQAVSQGVGSGGVGLAAHVRGEAPASRGLTMTIGTPHGAVSSDVRGAPVQVSLPRRAFASELHALPYSRSLKPDCSGPDTVPC
ncbi:MAG: hypothetical protein F4Z68_04050 [Nitrospira sp. SB0667_bin_9]|nr:hypothetical protein [Nitrospira sp. SB0667_bin_9]MYD30044.1 hypothetical protein [Nitrospira sp. SB0661_bin_20]MYJ23437.1 hypothetical protein [Nitrospira sp. SB0673_bin_12]